MKILSFLTGMILFSSLGFAQNYLQLENGTSCDLHVQLYAHNATSGNCEFVTATNYIVTSGTSLGATAPAGTEWVYAEVVQYPFGTGCGFGQALDTDGYRNCVRCPGYGAPTSAAVSTGGCNGCPSTIYMLWTAYCGNGPAHLHFYD